MHCHVEVHTLEGMGMVFNEAPEIEVKVPQGFPVCNNFYNDHSRDIQFASDTCKLMWFIFGFHGFIGSMPQFLSSKRATYNFQWNHGFISRENLC